MSNVDATDENITSCFSNNPQSCFVDCWPPPLSPNDTAGGITVNANLTDENATYPFGTTVTYSCPSGKVFNGTMALSSISSTCYGAYGWKRPYRLQCTGDGH